MFGMLCLLVWSSLLSCSVSSHRDSRPDYQNRFQTPPYRAAQSGLYFKVKQRMCGLSWGGMKELEAGSILLGEDESQLEEECNALISKKRHLRMWLTISGELQTWLQTTAFISWLVELSTNGWMRAFGRWNRNEVAGEHSRCNFWIDLPPDCARHLDPSHGFSPATWQDYRRVMESFF